MARWFHRTEKRLERGSPSEMTERYSAENFDSGSNANWVFNPNLPGGVPFKYLHVTAFPTDTITEFTAQEKIDHEAALAVAKILSDQAAAKGELDAEGVFNIVQRAIINHVTEKVNYLARRLIQTENVVAAMMTAAGNASDMKAQAILQDRQNVSQIGSMVHTTEAALHFHAVDIQNKPTSRQEVKDDIDAGNADT